MYCAYILFICGPNPPILSPVASQFVLNKSQLRTIHFSTNLRNFYQGVEQSESSPQSTQLQSNSRHTRENPVVSSEITIELW